MKTKEEIEARIKIYEGRLKYILDEHSVITYKAQVEILKWVLREK